MSWSARPVNGLGTPSNVTMNLGLESGLSLGTRTTQTESVITAEVIILPTWNNWLQWSTYRGCTVRGVEDGASAGMTGSRRLLTGNGGCSRSGLLMMKERVSRAFSRVASNRRSSGTETKDTTDQYQIWETITSDHPTDTQTGSNMHIQYKEPSNKQAVRWRWCTYYIRSTFYFIFEHKLSHLKTYCSGLLWFQHLETPSVRIKNASGLRTTKTNKKYRMKMSLRKKIIWNVEQTKI